MKWDVQFEHPAQIELAEAFHHYNRLSFGLGGDFLRMVAAAEERLAHNPLAYAPTGLRLASAASKAGMSFSKYGNSFETASSTNTATGKLEVFC